MNDTINTDATPGQVESPGTVPLSTALPSGTYNTEVGGGNPGHSDPDAKPDAGAEPEKKEDLRSVLEDEMKKSAKPEADPDPKPALEAKPEKKPEAIDPEPKNEPAPESGDEAQREGQGEASSEDDKSAPPARLTDEAKRYWRSTPRTIKAEFGRLESEITRLTQEGGEATRFHSELREYDGMAKQAGTSVKSALDRYVNFDRAIQQDFGKGIAAIAKDQGRQPQEVIGSILRAYGISPQQLAQIATQNPQAFSAPHQAQRDPAMQQLMQQNQQILQRFQQQDQQAEQAAIMGEVNRWAQGKSDYRQLEGSIAEIIQSGIIERIHGSGLSVVQRLDAAYRMAGGSYSAAHAEPAQSAPSAPRDPGSDPGRKSVRGAPSDGLTPNPPEEEVKDLKELLRKEMRKMA